MYLFSLPPAPVVGSRSCPPNKLQTILPEVALTNGASRSGLSSRIRVLPGRSKRGLQYQALKPNEGNVENQQARHMHQEEKGQVASKQPTVQQESRSARRKSARTCSQRGAPESRT